MAGIKFNSGVSNYKGTPFAISDTYANLVNYLPNIVGSLYFANDGTTETILQADGTTWVPISSAPGAGSDLQQVTDIGASSTNNLTLTGTDGIIVSNAFSTYSLGTGNRFNDGAGFFMEGNQFGIGQYSGFGNGTLLVLDDALGKILTYGNAGNNEGLRLDFLTRTYIVGEFLLDDNRLYMDGITGAASFAFVNLITLIAGDQKLYIDEGSTKIYTESSIGLIGLNLDFAANTYSLGDYNFELNNTRLDINDTLQTINFNTALGKYKFTNVATYATNALAVAGGLVTGQIYKNAAGVVSIVL